MRCRRQWPNLPHEHGVAAHDGVIRPSAVTGKARVVLVAVARTIGGRMPWEPEHGRLVA
jgi:hypothetical protein